MRTLKEVQDDITHAENLKERVLLDAREETDKDYRSDMYGRVDRINDRLSELYQERRELGSGKAFS